MPRSLADDRQIERQWRILQCIDCRHGISKRELVREFRVSERTIERDIKTLSLEGFPITEERENRQKMYRFLESYRFPTIEFSLTERLALALAQDLASFLKGTPYFNHLSKAIDKISISLPSGVIEHFSKMRSVLFFKTKAAGEYCEIADFITIAQEAALDLRCIELEYRTSNTGEIKRRKVDPYGILQNGNSLLLVGYCHNAEGIRNFCFDKRMLSLHALDGSFKRPENFDLEKYASGRFGGMHGQKIQAVVRIYPPVSRWVHDKNFPGLQKIVHLKNDVLEMHFDTEGREGLLRWVLHWGNAAEVIFPKDFRKQVAEEIHNMSKRYKKM